MTLKQIANYTNKLLPFLSITLGVESYRIAREEQNIRINVENSKLSAIKENLKNCEDIIISQQDNQNKVASLTGESADLLAAVKQEHIISKNIFEKLKDKLLSQQDKESLLNQLDLHSENQRKSIELARKSIDEIIDIITGSGNTNNYITSISDFINHYREFLSTLKLEQIGAIVHLSAIIFIFSCLITIVSIIYAEFLIQYFNLEVKYPKLKSFIELRRKFQHYYLFINLIGIIIVLLIITWFNLDILLS